MVDYSFGTEKNQVSFAANILLGVYTETALFSARFLGLVGNPTRDIRRIIRRLAGTAKISSIPRIEPEIRRAFDFAPNLIIALALTTLCQRVTSSCVNTSTGLNDIRRPKPLQCISLGPGSR